ncbi:MULTISPECIES: chemotaxis protein CheW [unclassified Sulfitobacter]|jgi:purine-binding chemotaxis protein CheW|uniref:chemotaxis protein CheW n=1 Tax=unclassified Sulfitobacter TaxID=196795 RepID=UPI00159378CA|nr:chemotaxis protein CheW [Sulfitobacter sp. HGT1]
MKIEDDSSNSEKFELITFSIGSQDFCMDIILVREIRGWTNVTMLPHAPKDVLGVMNLRGAVVPIVDLSARLGLGVCESKERDVIIITLIEKKIVGFLVTAVSDIIELSQTDIQPMPQMGGKKENQFVKGIYISDNKTLRVLDIASLAASMTTAQESV